MSMREPGWRARLGNLSPIGAAGPADGVGGGCLRRVVEGEGNVFVLNDADGGSEGEVVGDEDGFGVAVPKGPSG